MKAISTKILPATNTKPTRIKAYDMDRNSLTVSDVGQSHASVAMAFMRKYNWPMLPLEYGSTKEGFVFVCVSNLYR